MNKIKIFFIQLLLILSIINLLYAKDNTNIKSLNIEPIKLKKYKLFYKHDNDIIYNIHKQKIYIYKNLYLINTINLKFLKKEKIKNIIENKNIIILQTKNNKIIAIDKKNKKIKWNKNLNEKIFFTPLISENKLFIDKNGQTLIALDNENGNIIWKYNNNIENFFIHTNGKILQTNKYIFYIYSNKKIITLKKDNGEKIKSTNIEINNNINQKKQLNYISDITIYNKIIYICYKNGNFITINGLSGEILWKKNKKNYKNFIIKKKHIIIIKKNGHITLLNKFNGKKLWTNNNLKNKILTKPIILNKKFITIGDNKGLIHFFYIKNGKIKNNIKTNLNTIKKIFKTSFKNTILILNNQQLIELKLQICKK